MPPAHRRIGVIGVGFGAQVYVPGLASEGWDVVALCSRSRDKARKAADAAGIADVHTDPLELIRRDDLAAVAITSPPASHHALAIAALAAGKHVLCEKPFAMSAQQAAEMRDAARRSGRTAMIGHEFRHTPQRAYIRDLLADGYIGRFQLCTIELFLDRYVSPQHREEAMKTFFKSLVLAVAVRNGDAHLKNYGVLYENPTAGDIRLAPIYDIVTTVAYLPRDIPALSLGGAKKWWDVRALQKFGVAHCGLSQSSIKEIFDKVADAVSETTAGIRRYASDCPAFRETADKMLSAW